MLKVLTIFGTRPEAIKLAPVLVELRKYSNIESYVCVTAQHRQMLDQVLNIFNIVPDIDLDLMRDNQSLPDLTARVITRIDQILAKVLPNIVLIQGDTTTVMASAMAAFYRKIPVGHVEAGLRSGNMYSPFPEEMNRRIASLIAQYHFVPTEGSRKALIGEGVPAEKIFLTGNTVVDALLAILESPVPNSVDYLLNKAGMKDKDSSKKLVLVTAHRRENFGQGIENICNGLKALVDRNNDVVVLYPVHHNPNVRRPVFKILDGVERITLCDPVGYDAMAHLMNASHLILTDSGGIQEEAPSLGKPVLVMRKETERPEGIKAGTARLIGPYSESVVQETERLLNNKEEYRQMSLKVNPYGDGKASKRIVDIIASNN